MNFIEENSSAPTNGDAPAPLQYPPLPDALREQLGLELRPIKRIPVDVIVIDSANKEPTDN
ncbi:MAG TPA: TIGR03435 family protein [Acidobacteriaceae bacterium]|nr:TIGR03435 family protein [Acidobacteriaceae bacterium]